MCGRRERMDAVVTQKGSYGPNLASTDRGLGEFKVGDYIPPLPPVKPPHLGVGEVGFTHTHHWGRPILLSPRWDWIGPVGGEEVAEEPSGVGLNLLSMGHRFDRLPHPLRDVNGNHPILMLLLCVSLDVKQKVYSIFVQV